ncbi:MAG: divergent polysaccharide deacetylase family protein, partial [Desulfobacula sp.]|nr:divergent polysaccharide deacetylase family protein [Desulfobacula sp.]
MLHLPMEPMGYPRVNPGPGAILSGMSPDLLLDQLRKDIQEVPYVVGVNNHMGSRLTSHSDQMNQIFTILKKERLFFVDSRTSSASQCEASARLFKLKFAHRDVFLDNLQETAYITGQIKKLIDLAKKHGSAIGIGHPYKATLKALSRELPKLKNTVDIVRASDLTAIPG